MRTIASLADSPSLIAYMEAPAFPSDEADTQTNAQTICCRNAEAFVYDYDFDRELPRPARKTKLPSNRGVAVIDMGVPDTDDQIPRGVLVISTINTAAADPKPPISQGELESLIQILDSTERQGDHLTRTARAADLPSVYIDTYIRAHEDEMRLASLASPKPTVENVSARERALVLSKRLREALLASLVAKLNTIARYLEQKDRQTYQRAIELLDREREYFRSCLSATQK